MTEFKLSDNYKVKCEWKKTRQAFKHTAELISDDWETIDSTKICYLNRTWESYEYQDVLHKIIDKNFKGKEKELFKQEVDKQGKGKVDAFFKNISGIAKLGDIICDKKKDKNKFKKRILGTVNGIDFPEDFDKLPEDEKARRLNGAIDTISK